MKLINTKIHNVTNNAPPIVVKSHFVCIAKTVNATTTTVVKRIAIFTYYFRNGCSSIWGTKLFIKLQSLTISGSYCIVLNPTKYDSPTVNNDKKMMFVGEVRRTPSQQLMLIIVIRTKTSAHTPIITPASLPTKLCVVS